MKRNEVFSTIIVIKILNSCFSDVELIKKYRRFNRDLLVINRIMLYTKQPFIHQE
jgi:hypothetical protein